MKRACLILSALGCGRLGFGTPDDLRHDAPRLVDSSDALAAVLMCDAGRADLAACWDLGGDLVDGSQYGNPTTAVGSPPMFITGHSGLALAASAADVFVVTPTTSLALAHYTVEVWISPAMLPVTGRMMILDHDQQYGLALHPGGVIRCTRRGASADGAMVIAAGTWSHVGCTDDGYMLTTYVGGAPVAMTPLSPQSAETGTFAIAGNSPPGDAYIGALDQLHVWSRALDGSEMCRQAGC